MISTVTLNPSLDTVVILDKLKYSEVNRCERFFSYPGGKGIDVSRTIRKLGGETCALGIVGGSNGETLEKLLGKEGIPYDFVQVGGNTRNNILLECRDSGTETILLRQSGFHVERDILPEIKDKILEYAKKSSFMVFSGSVPDIFPQSIYKDLIEMVRGCGCTPVLDTSGESLRLGIESSPYMVKPNKSETEQLLGKDIVSMDNIFCAFNLLASHNIPLVLISLGKEGVVVNFDGTIFKVKPLQTEVLSYAGAGDSLIGGVVLGLARNLPIRETLKMGVAAASATLTEFGSSFFEVERYERYKKQVVIEELR